MSEIAFNIGRPTKTHVTGPSVFSLSSWISRQVSPGVFLVHQGLAARIRLILHLQQREVLKHGLNLPVLFNCLENVLWWRFTLPRKGQWENDSVLTCCSNKTAGFLGFKEVMGKCYLSSASLKTKYYCKPEQTKSWLLSCCMWQSRSCCNYLSLESILY